jgi:hypothetical protein
MRTESLWFRHVLAIPWSRSAVFRLNTSLECCFNLGESIYMYSKICLGYTLLQHRAKQGDFPAREIVVLEMTTFTDARVFSGVGPPLNGNL